MSLVEMGATEPEAVSDFARVMRADTCQQQDRRTGRISLDQADVKNGLGRLVLTLVKLLHELLERQALRRIDAGSLSDEEIERLGVTLMKQAQEIERLRDAFGLEDDDLNLDLGPLGKLLSD